MTFRKALLAATVLALPVAAQAQPVTGLYVGAGAGVNFRDDADGNYSRSTISTLGLPGTTVGGKATAITEPGWAAVASIGWGFGNGLRAEVEGNYRTNDVRKYKVPGIVGTAGSGYLENYAAMVNVLYDFNFGWPVVPYIGAGVGYGWNQIRKGARIGFPSTQTEGELAYQGIAGIAYQLTPNLAFTLEGRYYGTTDPSFKDASRVTPTVSQRVNWKPSNDNYSALVGIRYAFYSPAPPPAAPVVAPVAPPAAARTYLVFFDWDRADLTARAREIITEAAQNSRRVSSTRIEVAGHADRSGTPQYNQRLSQRRADNVAAELVRQGISRNEITVTAYGESRPLVPTADGVREPQNRRVEIVLR
ncbi:OmpA family protein [Paracraurococcus lichenis]|uniref:OmpA family protein n=1 Tax=Paracraurococcus lichenis TaxID=3064888 RepID=A0ABT9E4R5_9PROT|nr:OmpA family protein [Paracraurococcus sp. LOR1-02]MDO9711159.1 OmpA family protein [Paracraurococcus sp. LOR1-02]